jgi:Ca2+/Na+ antiporter
MRHWERLFNVTEAFIRGDAGLPQLRKADRGYPSSERRGDRALRAANAAFVLAALLVLAALVAVGRQVPAFFTWMLDEHPGILVVSVTVLLFIGYMWLAYRANQPRRRRRR